MLRSPYKYASQSFYKLSRGRGYASRQPVRPPIKISDPLLRDPSAQVQELPGNLTFITRKPPSAPSPLSTTLAPSSPLLRPPTQPVHASASASASSSPSSSPSLPPFSRKQRIHDNAVLSDANLVEMRRLRIENPRKYTRGKLAQMFKCPPYLIAQLAPLGGKDYREAIQKREEQHQKIRERWGENKTLARAIRAKRRTFW